MGKGLSGAEWSARIAAERGRRMEAGSHVDKLLAARKLEHSSKKEAAIDFRAYVEMHRNLSGADGKSR